MTCFSAIVLLVFASCKQPYSNRELTKLTYEDFKDHRTGKLTKALPDDSLILPTKCEIIGNILLVADQKGSKHVHVFDLDSSKYRGAFGPTGQGPGEIITPWVTSVDQRGWFYLYDITNKKIMGWHPDSLVAGIGPGHERKFNEGGITSSLAFFDDAIWLTDITRPNGRFFKTDTSNLPPTSVGDLPIITSSAAPTTLSQANRSTVAFGNNKFVVANYLSPFLEIYDPAKNTWKSILAPESLEPEFKEAQYEGSKVFVVDKKKTRVSFIDVKTTDKFIYLLYSGELAVNMSHDYGKELLIFDYQGQPVKRITLEKPIVAFAVYGDSIGYGLNVELTPQILSFGIN